MVKCPNCGNEVSRDEFCSKCGLKLNHTSKNINITVQSAVLKLV